MNVFAHIPNNKSLNESKYRKKMKNLIQNHESHAFDATAIADFMIKVTKSSESRIHLYSDKLDPELFDNSYLADALSRFVNTSRHHDCKILIEDISVAIKTRHALVEKCKRIPSRLPVKMLAKNTQPPYSLLFLADNDTYLAIDRNAEGVFYFHESDAVSVKALREVFDHHWQQSGEIADIRVLG